MLVPRPETEVVVERCLELLRGLEAPGGARRRHRLGRDRARDRRRAPGRARDGDRRLGGRARARRARTPRAPGSTVELRRARLRRRPRRPYDLVVSNPPYVYARRSSSRSSRRCATGSRSSRSSTRPDRGGRPGGARRARARAAGSCSRSATAAARRSRALLRGARLRRRARSRRIWPGATEWSRDDGRVDAGRSGDPRGRAGASCRPTPSTGSCATPYREAAGARLYRLKGRPSGSRSALLCADVDDAARVRPGAARPRRRWRARCCPGPYTLVLPNPARRFRWLAATRRDDRRPRARARRPTRRDRRAVGAVAATSANRHGGPDPRRLDDVPAEIRAACAADRRRRRAAGHAVDRARPDRRASRACSARAPCRRPRRSSGCARRGRVASGAMAPLRGRRAGDPRRTSAARGSPTSIPRSPS